jgi:8-oxo-dGTP pyrophosphatase MutT (NUDIX family)
VNSARMSRFLPLQVAAVCYRRRSTSFEFLLVNTTSGNKWTFPKGATGRRLSHSQAAEREALEEAGAVGLIEPHHFHLYLHPSQRNGVEFVVKAFLLEVSHTQPPQEPRRNPCPSSKLHAFAESMILRKLHSSEGIGRIGA